VLLNRLQDRHDGIGTATNIVDDACYRFEIKVRL
jgi:hypothetical protein